ncbi:hypothetical protein FOZ63_012328, partial [Perkinsus olseni]
EGGASIETFGKEYVAGGCNPSLVIHLLVVHGAELYAPYSRERSLTLRASGLGVEYSAFMGLQVRDRLGFGRSGIPLTELRLPKRFHLEVWTKSHAVGEAGRVGTFGTHVQRARYSVEYSVFMGLQVRDRLGFGGSGL